MTPFFDGGMLIDGDGATEESVGKLDPETKAIVDADLKIKPEDRTAFDDQRDAVYQEYQDDMAKLTDNINKAHERAQKALEEGNMDRYNTWMASADRYGRLMEIEGRLLDVGLRNVDTREKISNPGTAPGGSTPMTFPDKGNPGGEPSVGATPRTPSSTGSGRSNRDQEKPPVKTAPIDTILFNQEDFPVQIMLDLIFEDIGGQELINIARNDTINGQNVIYQPIKNLTQIQQQYNPNNILKLQNTSDTYFENFPIKFDEKVPDYATGPGGSHVYIDPLTGDLIIESINTAEDEEVQVEITVSGTIYEAEI